MDIPTKKILDRSLVRATIQDYREHAARALAEIVDEGISVFQRCSASAEGKDENLGILFPALHVFEMLDGVDILLREGAVIPARLPLRSAFEASLIVNYVLQAESKRRGAAYVVAEIHRRINGLKRWDPDSERGKQFRAELRKDKHGTDVNLPEVDDLEDRISSLEGLLDEPHLKAAADEYQRTTAASRTSTPPFYRLWNGPANIEQLAREVERGGQYEILYRTWSRTAHSVDLDRQLTEEEGHPAIRVFRDPDQIAVTYSLAISIGLGTIRALLSHYRPEEWEKGSFAEWYKEKIRPAFQALPIGDTTYEPTESDE